MDFKETLLDSKDFERTTIYKNNEKITNKQAEDISFKIDAFHDANIFSKLFFCWVNKIFGVKQYLYIYINIRLLEKIRKLLVKI